MRTLFARRCALITLLGLGSITAAAAVDIEFRPDWQSVNVGDTVDVELYLVASNGGNELVSALDLFFGWDNTYLDLLGLDHTGEPSLLRSEFLAGDLFGVNEVVPPQDGDGLYQAQAMLGQPIVATPLGTFITTLQFEALAETAGTDVIILPSAGTPTRDTAVFDGTVPNLDITGTFSGATVEIVPEPATWLLILLAGACGRRR